MDDVLRREILGALDEVEQLFIEQRAAMDRLTAALTAGFLALERRLVAVDTKEGE